MAKGSVLRARVFIWVKNIQRKQLSAFHLKAKLAVCIRRQCLVPGYLENWIERIGSPDGTVT